MLNSIYKAVFGLTIFTKVLLRETGCVKQYYNYIYFFQNFINLTPGIKHVNPMPVITPKPKETSLLESI